MNLKPKLRALLLATALAAPIPALADDLVIATKSGPASMDPHFTATSANAEATKQIFDTLLKSGNDLQIEPQLATEWKAIDDTTWEFTLREGVKFHDGSDFTAEDVKFSIERIPNVTGPNPTTVYVRNVAGTEIVDPHTIRIKTHGPAPTQRLAPLFDADDWRSASVRADADRGSRPNTVVDMPRRRRLACAPATRSSPLRARS